MLIPEQCTCSGCQHIPTPINISSIGQRKDEAITKRPCDNRCRVSMTRATANVLERGIHSLAVYGNLEGERVQHPPVETAYAVA